MIADWGWPILVTAVGYMVLGLTGFGSALIVVPLLSWQWPLPEVVALTLLMDVPASASLGGLNWRQVQWRDLTPLLPGVAVGVAAGWFLSTSLQARWPLLLLGVYVAVIGVRGIRGLRDVRSAANRVLPQGSTFVAGCCAGLIEMLFGTSGPVIVAWMSRRRTDVHALRANVAVAIMMTAAAALAGMGLAGRLSNPALWHRWIPLFAVALLGLWCGHKLSYRAPAYRLRQIIYALLIVSGLALAIRALA